MRTALVATVILVSVYGFVGLYAWWANRSLAPGIDEAADATLKARATGLSYVRPKTSVLTPEQSRIVVALFGVLFIVSYGAMFTGAFLADRGGLGIGLALGGLILLLSRSVIVGRVIRRFETKAMHSGSGHD